MSTTPVANLDDLANDYAARWSAARPVPNRVRPADDAERPGALEANGTLLYFTEILLDYSRCGINE